MGIKKDIGPSIKSRISEFKDSPDDIVWTQIEEKLNEKKKKEKLFFILFRYGTIFLAVSLLVFLNKDLFKLPYNTKQSESKIENVESTRSSTNQSKRKDNNSENPKTINKTNSPFKIENFSTEEVLAKSNEDNFDQSHNYNSKKQQKQSSKSSIEMANHKIDYKNTNNDSLTSADSKTSSLYISDIQEDSSSDIKTDIKNDSLVDESPKPRTKTRKKQSKKITEKDTTKPDKPRYKWSVYPNVSFISYNGFNKSFKNTITTNYGIYVNYMPNNKLNLRIGFNNLQLQQEYDVDNATLRQEINYFEFPLELKYNLSKSKIQPYIITGVSYLYLDKAVLITNQSNNVFTNESNRSDFMNSTVSLNAAIGVQTKIYKRFYLNGESAFKYHFSPYSKSVDFNPYTISLMFGIEYKF